MTLNFTRFSNAFIFVMYIVLLSFHRISVFMYSDSKKDM